MSDNDFSWEKDESIVVETVKAIAVYTNPKGNIVIRQQSEDDHLDDSFLVVPPSKVSDLIGALMQEANLDLDELES